MHRNDGVESRGRVCRTLYSEKLLALEEQVRAESRGRVRSLCSVKLLALEERVRDESRGRVRSLYSVKLLAREEQVRADGGEMLEIESRGHDRGESAAT